MKKRLFSLVSIGALLTSTLLTTGFSYQSEPSSSYDNFDVERYTDRIDVDSYLDKLSQDEDFLKQAEEKIKQQAAELNFNDEEEESEDNATDSTFTYDGGTKSFLDYELGFKEFTLRSEGENVEIWVANDLSFPDDRPDHVVTQEQVDKLRDEFDSNIYPVATEFFGTPDELDGSNSLLIDMGVVPEGYYEGSDKVIMLVDNVKDENYYDPTYPFFVAGFYWGTLESYIDRNIITIDTNNWEERLENTFFSTTIHELQHLIHADNDSDETSWLNEGMSTFSEFLGGYGIDEGSISFLLDHPENSLTSWDDHYSAETGPETIADYGLVQLFTLYNYEQFGQEFIREVALNETNSIESFNEVLANNNINLSFNDVYRNFSTALLIDDTSRKGGIYGFENVDLRAIGDNGVTVNFEEAQQYEKEGVPAWGTDFKVLNFQDKIDTISFNGIDFLPIPWETVTDPLGSGNQVYWGGEGDELDNKLTFEADLSDVSEATLTFDNFIDIEEQWDFGMVQISTDGGDTWSSLENENTRSDVVAEGYPKIKENVPGFSGHYENWQTETFDLSDYAGQNVYLSFRYLTDWGYNDTGWFIDNIEIPEIGLSFDGEDSSLSGFTNYSELLNNYVDYGVSFINDRGKGKYKVIHVDPFNVTEEDALQLRQLFQKGTTYMNTYYAAPQDSLTPVDFEYEVQFKTKGPKK